MTTSKMTAVGILALVVIGSLLLIGTAPSVVAGNWTDDVTHYSSGTFWSNDPQWSVPGAPNYDWTMDVKHYPDGAPAIIPEE